MTRASAPHPVRHPAPDPTRRAALRVLATTAAAWWGGAQAQGTARPPAGPLRIGCQKGTVNLVLLKSLGLLDQPALVAEQQKVADAFVQLGLIPRAIRVADIVWQPGRVVGALR